MKKIENLEAARARFAFEEAGKGNQEQDNAKKKGAEFNYSAVVKELPSMLRMNGLRATMAFYYSKEKAHRRVFEQIRNWFRHENEPTKMMSIKFPAPAKEEKPEVFMKILLALSDDEYRIVQAETLTLANWMIRFVKEEKSSSTTENQADGQP